MSELSVLLTKIEINPKDVASLVELGGVYEAQGALEKAFYCYQRALSIDSDHEFALLHFGALLILADEYRDAAQILGHCLDVNAGNSHAWLNLGIALLGLGEREDAVVAFREARQIDPMLEDASVNLARTLFDLARCEESLEVLDQIRSLELVRPDVCVFRINALTALNRFDEAVDLADKIPILHSSSAYALGVAGLIRLMVGNIVGANDLFDQALAIDPRCYDGLYGKGMIHLTEGNIVDARRDFLTIIPFDPDRFEAYLQLANIAFSEGDYAQLAHWTNEGLQRAPMHSGLLFFAHLVLKKQKKYTECEEILGKILSINEKHQPAHVELAKILLDVRHDSLRAKAHLQAAIDIDPNSEFGKKANEALLLL